MREVFCASVVFELWIGCRTLCDFAAAPINHRIFQFSLSCASSRVPDIRWNMTLGVHMRKAVLLLAVLLAASLSTSADAAKKKAAAKPDPAMAAQQNTAKFIGAAMNPGMAQAATPAKPAKKAKKAYSRSTSLTGNSGRSAPSFRPEPLGPRWDMPSRGLFA